MLAFTLRSPEATDTSWGVPSCEAVETQCLQSWHCQAFLECPTPGMKWLRPGPGWPWVHCPKQCAYWSWPYSIGILIPQLKQVWLTGPFFPVQHKYGVYYCQMQWQYSSHLDATCWQGNPRGPFSFWNYPRLNNSSHPQTSSDYERDFICWRWTAPKPFNNQMSR